MSQVNYGRKEELEFKTLSEEELSLSENGNVDMGLGKAISSALIEKSSNLEQEMGNRSDSSSSFSKTLLSDQNDSKGGSSSKTMLKIDQHGRLVKQEKAPAELSDEERRALRRSNEKMLKWTKMLREWNRFAQPGNVKLKRRLRKGCPNALRSSIYPLVMKTQEYRSGKTDLFEELCLQDQGPFDEVIKRDLHRTNPEHVMFMSKKGSGQHSLYRVLRAYSLFDKQVGYCQGMGSFVSVMLTYVTEEDAFWLLVSLMQGNHPQRETYLPNLIGLRRSFYVFGQCLQRFLPKLARHLAEETFSPAIYSSRWFGTLCADLPIEVTLRVWDILINEGPKILYRMGLAILKSCRKRLLVSRFEEFSQIIKETQANLEPDSIIASALSFKLRRKHLKMWSTEFDALEAANPGSVM